MNISHNSQYFKYGKYSVFAVVFALVFMISSVALAEDNVEKNATGQEHWSNVAKVVQSLRSVAGRDSNIGQEVRKVAQEQEDSAKEAEEAMGGVDSVGRFRQFFLETDYKNLGVLRSELVKTQNAIDRLTKSIERATGVSVKADLQEQIDALKAIQTKAEAFAKDHEDRFSLLGWFVKLFN